jgi:hypothetical protein
VIEHVLGHEFLAGRVYHRGVLLESLFRSRR